MKKKPHDTAPEIQAEEAKPPPLVKAALIDANGFYLRMDELPEDQLTERHLPEVTACDLKPHSARWNHAKKTFELTRKTSPNLAPDAMNAIALGLIALLQHTKTPCPQDTLTWLKSHTASFDFKGDLSTPDSTKS